MIRMMHAIRTGVLVAAVLAGMPLILAAVAGSPHPDRLPTAGQFQAWVDEPFAPRYAAATARAFAWLVWAALTAAVLAAAGAQLRRRPWKRLAGYLPGPVQGLAAALVGAATVTTATSGLASAASPPSTTAPHGLAPTDARARSDAPAARATMIATPVARPPVSDAPTEPRPVTGATPVTTARAPQPRLPVYTVARGDQMVDVAERFLGDPGRYIEIARLNPQWERHDDRFPDHWEPGWRVVLPPDAHWRAPHRHATGRLVVPTTPPTAVPDPAPGPATPARPSAAPPTSTYPTRSAPTTQDTATQLPSTPPSPATAEARSEATRSPVPAPTSTGQPPTAPDTDAEHGVDLPGGWVSLPLAAALVTAAAMVWRQRRRRYRPRPVGDEPLDDPDLRPLPPVVTRMRRAVRDQEPGLLDPQPASRQPTVAQYAHIHAGADEVELPPAGPSGADLAGFADRIPAGGLGLTGPGAEPAARALLVAALSTGGPADPDARGHVIIPAESLTALLRAPAVEIAPLPRMIVTASLSDALIRVEELLLERRRHLQDYDAADLPALRAATPYHPPMPPVLLLADVPAPELTARLSTALHLGAALQISAVLLGEWACGDTTTVQADGRITTLDHQRLAILDAPTTRQMLQVLREAHTGQPAGSPDPSASHPSTANCGGATADRPAPPAAEAIAAEPTSAPTSVEATAVTAAPAITSPIESVEASGPSAETATDPALADPGEIPPTPSPQPRRRMVGIRLLGEPAIVDRDGITVTGLRRHARQLLVYLAVHRDGADLPQIMEAFWPTATLRRAGERLSTEVGHLRSRIRQAAGDQKIQPVINTGGRYVLNAAVLDIDLWRMSDALRRAAAATDRPARIAALREAVSAHTGHLADGQDYDWIEQHREQVRRHGVRARLHLADLLAEAEPGHAATLAQSAADLDRYNEDAARHAMRTLARMSDAAGIRARLQRLHDALDEIDEEPSDETLTLATQLQRQISTSTDPRWGDRPDVRSDTTSSQAPAPAPDPNE